MTTKTVVQETVGQDAEVDFDLPEVASSGPTKLRVHIADTGLCVACEG